MNPIILAHILWRPSVDILYTAERDTPPTVTNYQYVTLLTGLLTGIRKVKAKCLLLSRQRVAPTSN